MRMSMPTTMAATVRICFCALRVRPFALVLLVALFGLLVLVLLVLFLLVLFLLALLARAIVASSLMNSRTCSLFYSMK
jgi:hypothetical protein